MAMAASFRVAANGGEPLREDGFLACGIEGDPPGPLGAAPALDRVRQPLAADAPLPPPPPPPSAGGAATPGEALLAERERAWRVADGLAGWLVQQRPGMVRARFGPLAAGAGQEVTLPLSLEVDPGAYAALAEEFCRRVTLYTGREGTRVSMPVHADSLEDGQIFLGPPVLDGEAGDAAPVPYADGMNLLVCLRMEPRAAGAPWPGEAGPVAQHPAAWRVYDLPPEWTRALAREAVTRHGFHVRPVLCDRQGAEIALPPSAAGRFPFAVRGLFVSPEAGSLVILPWLFGQEAHSWADPAGGGGLADPAGPPGWRRVARFSVPDGLLPGVAAYRCVYGTHCLDGPEYRPCAAHADRD